MLVLTCLMSTLSYVKKEAIAKGGITWIIYIVILHSSLLFKRTGGKTKEWKYMGQDGRLTLTCHTRARCLWREAPKVRVYNETIGKNRQKGEEKEKMKAKGRYAGFLFLFRIGRGDSDHVLPFRKDQKCYRAFVITSCFQQIGNNFSEYGLVSQSWMGSISFHWEYILACCSIHVKSLSEMQNVLLVPAMTRHKEKRRRKSICFFLPYTLKA